MKNITTIKTLQMIILSILWAISLNAFAQVKVVVIPLGGGDFKPLKNVITVAKANGDFADPVEALKSITDSSDTNPYLVVIAPGVYTLSETLHMPGHVSVVGSGRRVTKLVAAIGSSGLGVSATAVSGSGEGRTLSDLSIVNTGNGSSYSIGVYVSGDDLFIERVDILVSGGSNNNYGIHNTSDGLISDVTVKATGGFSANAIVNVGAPEIRNVRASASGASINNYGVNNQFGAPVINNLTAIASGANSYGIRYAGGATRITNSYLEGDTAGVDITGTDVRITFTVINGGVTDSELATSQCFGTHDSAFSVFDPC